MGNMCSIRLYKMILSLLINVYMYQRLVQGGAEYDTIALIRYELHVNCSVRRSFSIIVALSITTFGAIGRANQTKISMIWLSSSHQELHSSGLSKAQL